jgi:hypothetical protein
MKALHLSPDLSLPLNAVTQTFAFMARRGAGKTYAAGKLCEEMVVAGAQVVVLDPVGVWWGLRLAADGKAKGLDIPVFGGLRGDIPLEPGAGALVADVVVDKGISVVLDVSLFRKGDRKRFATEFAEQLFHRKKTARTPLHVFVEEAQVFVPQRAMGDEARMLGAFEDLVKLGRNFGIGVTLISQRPQSVNKDALNQTEALFVLQTGGSQERKALKEWVVDQGLSVDLVNELPSLPIGTAYVWSPQWLQVLKKVKIGKKKTFDGSATPVLGAEPEKERELAPVDLEKIRAAMKDVVARAEVNDPKALRRRVAELEAKLAKAPAQVIPPAAKVERVEVPVLKDSQIKRLEATVCRWEKLSKPTQESLRKVLAAVSRVKDFPVQAPAQPPRRHTAAPAPLQSRESRPQGPPPATGEGLGVGQRILDTIAMLNVRGLPVTRQAVARWMGIHPNGGRFLTSLARLRESGHLDGLALTEAGNAAAHCGGTGAGALLAAIRETKREGRARATMMEAILNEPAGFPSRVDLAAAMGVHPNGGRFLTNLARLREMGVIPERGDIKAVEGVYR